VSDDWLRDLKWSVIAYAAVAGTALVAILGLRLFVPALRRRWLPLPRLRPGTWTGYEVLLAFCVTIGFPSFIVLILSQIGFFVPLIGIGPDVEPSDPKAQAYFARCVNISSPLIVAVVLGTLFAVLFARRGAWPHQYGASWSRWPANVGLGLLASP
jgi:hypothetical protein